MKRARRDESGQMAGIEVLPFGLLTFVVGALLVANAWAVIDAKIAVSAAAREATRAFVEAPVDTDPLAMADTAARSAIEGAGRDPDQLVLTPLEATFARCETVSFEASYQIPAIRLPWIGGAGDGFTATARHAEVVDPYRTGVPRTVNGCVSTP
ncbi:MAG TPA: hypothetical protein VGV86_03655 [Acidimicrobiales bacterium]|nr:hypothetical protein [Acidimicrobiales bacterium]